MSAKILLNFFRCISLNASIKRERCRIGQEVNYIGLFIGLGTKTIRDTELIKEIELNNNFYFRIRNFFSSKKQIH